MGVAASAEAAQQEEQAPPQQEEPPKKGAPEQDDDEDDACGFCRYMKGGGCKAEFKAWSGCVDAERQEGRDFTEECRTKTLDLQQCMHEHSDYYKDILYEQAGEQSLEGVQDEILEHDHKALPEGGEQESSGEASDEASSSGDDSKPKSEGDQPDSQAEPADDKSSQQQPEQKGSDSKPPDKPQEGGKPDSQKQDGKPAGKPEGGQQQDSKPADKPEGGQKPDGKPAGEPKGDSSSSGGSDKGKDQTQKDIKGEDRSPKNKTEGEPPSAVSNKVGGGEKGTKNPGGQEGTKEDSSDSGEDSSSSNEGGDDKAADSGDSEEPEEEEEEEPAHEVQVGTVPYDPRFPGINQARTCYTRYNEFYKCKAVKSEDDPECKIHQRAYRSLCPGDWVDKWNEAREEGNWFGRY